MKHIRALLSVIFLSIFIAAPAIQAATPASQTPSNTSVHIELNSSNAPVNMAEIETAIDNLTESAGGELTSLHQLFINNLDKNKLSLSIIPHNDNQDVFISMGLDLDKFQEFVKDNSELEKEDLGLSRVIYSMGQDVFLTYKDGRVIVSNNHGLISDLLMIENYPSLSKNALYSAFENKINQNSFMKLFFQFDENSENLDLPIFSKWFNYEGLALSQNSNGLNGEFLVGLNPQSGMNFSKFQFSPSLYQKVNQTDLILYSETNNTTERQKEAYKMFSSDVTMDMDQMFDEIKNVFSSNLNLNVDQDIAPLFQAKTAFFIHNDTANQAFPAITVITEVRGQEGKAQNLVNQLDQSITAIAKKSAHDLLENEIAYRQNYKEYYSEEELKNLPALPSEEELVKRLFSSKDIDVNGQKLRQFTFTMNNGLNEKIDNTHKDQTIKLTMGVTTEGQLIATTLQQPEKYLIQPTNSSLPAGLNSNQSLDYSFINFDNLEKYIVATYDNYNDSTSYNYQENRQEFIDWMTKFMSPLDTFISYTTYSDNTLKSSFTLKMDLSKIANYVEAFQGLSSFGLRNDYNIPDYSDYSEYVSEENFSDVNADDWFSYYVTQMQSYGIMKGYNDNTFHPNQSISRAEFLVALMKTEDYVGTYLSEVEPDQYFSDVAADAWYASAVNKARAHGYIKGFDDNTFRPNQPITRAEAIQIITNSNNQLIKYPDESPEMNFKDVKNTDWFYDGVKEAFTAGIISGKNETTFAPADHLTRAETAKILFEYIMNVNFFIQ